MNLTIDEQEAAEREVNFRGVHILSVKNWPAEEDERTGEWLDAEQDWEVIHPATCEYKDTEVGPDAIASREYLCWMDTELEAAGLDSLPDPVEGMATGMYAIQCWWDTWHHYEYGPQHEGGISVLSKLSALAAVDEGATVGERSDT
jgi:hypothetical protein